MRYASSRDVSAKVRLQSSWARLLVSVTALLLLVGAALHGLRPLREAARSGFVPGWLQVSGEVDEANLQPEAGLACAQPAKIYRDGAERGEVCPGDASRHGLTVIDLSDRWAPRILAPAPALGEVGEQPYRARYVALADGRLATLPEEHRAHDDVDLELYGIAPSLRLVRDRLADDPRHQCHDGVSRRGLAALDRPLDAWKPVAAQRAERWTIRSMRALLERAADGRALDELSDEPRHASKLKVYRRLALQAEAIAEAQAHLRCEGWLEAAGPDHLAVLDPTTVRALHRYHRRHALITWTLDEETAGVMSTDSRRLDHRQALRVLRERIVDATGLLEDGTAAGEHRRVMGEPLDSMAMHQVGPLAALEGGAPDRVGAATEAAAHHLGWSDAAATRRWLDARGDSIELMVALPLPSPPPYHSPHMDLRVEIDRGDISHLGPAPGQRRPTLTLYTVHQGRTIPLVRWGTTVGGRKLELGVGGQVVKKAKPSPVGPRIWRDLMVTPRWIPPRRTPPRELLRPLRHGWTLRDDLLGPSYASAYGLVAMIHHRDDGAHLTDQGIRTHGSAKYDSIHQGTSHGCHRLHNHRAVRLAGFLLRHRQHVARGAEPFGLHRTFRYGRHAFRRVFETRGFRYELTPPVPVDVTRGHHLGWRRRPSPGD